VSLFVYVLAAIIVGGNWEAIFFASIILHFEFNAELCVSEASLCYVHCNQLDPFHKYKLNTSVYDNLWVLIL